MPKKYTYWVYSGKYSMMQKLFIMTFGVLSFMILAREWALQQELLGVWGLFIIISSIVETLRHALIKNGYILFIHTKDPREHPEVEYAAIFINMVYSLVFIGLSIALSNFLESFFNAPGLATLLKYYCITLVLLIPYFQYEIFFVSKTDFRSIFWMYFTRNGLLFAGIVLLYFGNFHINFTILALLNAASTLMGLTAGLIAGKNHAKRFFKKSKKTLLEFVGFGKFVFGNNLFSLVFRSTDSFTTASLISAAVSAYYSTCARITNLVDLPSQVFADIMFPKAAQTVLKDGHKGIKRIYENTVAASLTFTLPALFVILIFPKYLLHIVAGKEYIKAAPLLQLIVLYGLFLPFIKQFGNAMDVIRRPKVNSLLMGIFAFLNIGFNILGIRLWGWYGSAYATLLSYFLLFVTTQIILSRLLKVSQLNIFKNIFHLYSTYLSMIKEFFKTRLHTAKVKAPEKQI